MTITTTANYVKLTIKGSNTYLLTTPNPFDYQTSRYIYLYNIRHSRTTSNKYVYPTYVSLYKSDVVNPIAYNFMRTINVQPGYGGLTGVSHMQYSDIYDSNNNYPNFMRF
jgi:hypothetical protein